MAEKKYLDSTGLIRLIANVFNSFSPKEHSHDDVYYTESEIDSKFHSITSGDVVVAEAVHAESSDNAENATHSVSADTATNAINANHAADADSAISAIKDASGNIITSTYETKIDAFAKLDNAKSYADEIKNELLNGAGAAYDTLKELGDLIDVNVDAIDVLETVAASKASASDLTSHTSNKSNPHGVTAAQVGLGNVNNTSDADKPVSTAQQSAIDSAKSSAVSSANAYTDDAIESLGDTYYTESEIDSKVSALNTAISGKATAGDLTSHTSNTENPHGVTAAQVGALPLSGGTMTGEIKVGQGDGYGIQLGTNGRINATTSTGSTTATMFGLTSSTSAVFGHSAFATNIRGSTTRPTYNGKDMALYSDVTALQATVDELASSVVTVHSGAEEPISTLGEDGDLYLVTE